MFNDAGHKFDMFRDLLQKKTLSDKGDYFGGRPLCRESCEYATKICKKELEMAKIYDQDWGNIQCTDFKYRNAGDNPECYYTRELNNADVDTTQANERLFENPTAAHTPTARTYVIHSCVPAQSPIDANSISGKCFPYQYPNGYCKRFLGNSSLFASSREQAKKERNLKLLDNGRKMLEQYQIVVSKACVKVFIELNCHWNYPKCDLTSSTIVGRPPCRESCEYGTKICAKELEMAMGFNKQQGQDGWPLYWVIINCTDFKYRNAGDNPECHYLRELNNETDKLQDKDCYYGNGLGYSGTVSVTRSGPTRSPVVFQAFSTGPYKISIEWQPVPLPFVHGTPRGFRIRISKFGGNDSIVNTTGVDIKYFEVENLQPLTDYTLSVLEFNEIRDGPWSRPVYVQTMPQTPPPPPTNLSQSDVSQTSVTVDWSAPAHQEPFRITNYTVQYKKADTKMPYYDAVVVSSDQRTVDVDNLDSNTKYLIRVMSINVYGSQPSEIMVVNTKGQ
ncbi:hypothetical protein QZH41_004875 [Actinostola sp. cb2023]|nr:hypothetical protein QZH41_004875 [Actinostola sp. cb2023]